MEYLIVGTVIGILMGLMSAGSCCTRDAQRLQALRDSIPPDLSHRDAKREWRARRHGLLVPCDAIRHVIPASWIRRLGLRPELEMHRGYVRIVLTLPIWTGVVAAACNMPIVGMTCVGVMLTIATFGLWIALRSSKMKLGNVRKEEKETT